MKKTILAAILVATLATAIIGYLALETDLISAPSAAVQAQHAADDGHANHDEARSQEDTSHEDGAEAGHEGEEGVIHLDDRQIARAGIEVVEAVAGEISKDVAVIGTVIADADRTVHVTTRIPGIVSDIAKRLGEPVEQGEVLAILESRELAEAKAAYLSSLRQARLQSTKLEREKALWRKKVSAEQDYLDAQAAAATAQISLDAAQQRLVTLGLKDDEIKRLQDQPAQGMSLLEIRSPLSGRVIDRTVTRGELVPADKEIFRIADLSTVWVEFPVYGADLPLVREGQQVSVTGSGGQTAEGRIIFVSPTIEPDTGAARAVGSLNNAEGTWRPGDFVSGVISTGGAAAQVVLPTSAIQTVGGETVVFARLEDGFEKRTVEIGRRNGRFAEVLFGVFAGDRVASGNTFVLKAEASRGAAEHSHAH